MFIPWCAALTAQAVLPATNAGAWPSLQETVPKIAPAEPEQPWPPAGVFRAGDSRQDPVAATRA
jgi:hypothetical protein